MGYSFYDITDRNYYTFYNEEKRRNNMKLMDKIRNIRKEYNNIGRENDVMDQSFEDFADEVIELLKQKS